MTTRKLSMSIPIDLVLELDLIAEHLSITRSALVSALLVPIVPRYVSICGRSSVYGGHTARRFTGQGRGDILGYLEELEDSLVEVQGELFTD